MFRVGARWRCCCCAPGQTATLDIEPPIAPSSRRRPSKRVIAQHGEGGRRGRRDTRQSGVPPRRGSDPNRQRRLLVEVVVCQLCSTTRIDCARNCCCRCI